VSRVFDALRKTGSQCDPSMPFSASAPFAPAAFVDAIDKTFQLESFSTARIQLSEESHLVLHVEQNGPGAERYRLLRHRLQGAHAEAHVRTLLITSPGAREGKSTVSLNLAAALAEKKNQQVLLLEGDLRCPSLTRELGLTLPSGLTQCARTDIGLKSAIWRIEPLGFYLLPAGKAVDNPAELLTSEWFSTAVAELAASFDWIVIDAPPALPVVDALTLKRFADASLIVAWAGRTQQRAIEEAIRLLGRNHVLGVVLNGLEKLDQDYYEYYRHYGGKM
jgi:polysaccharide biosynthesis transport protein